jgi:hypothetical protein
VQPFKDEFERRGIRILVISFAAPALLAEYQKLHQWPFTILADPEREAYRYFGLARLPWYRVFSPATIQLYASLLLKGKKLENYGRDDYRQSGGDFLLDSTGRLVFAHRSRDPADRPPVQTLLAAADRMRRENLAGKMSSKKRGETLTDGEES